MSFETSPKDRKRYWLRGLLAIVMLTGMAACNTPETEVEVEQSEFDVETQTEDLSAAARDDAPGGFDDDQLEEFIQTQMSTVPEVDLSEVTVEVTNGSAILSGSVNSLAGRIEAEEIAQQTEGITAVTNNVEVVAANLADGEVTASVLEALETEPLLERYEISAETTNGNVELIGLVDNYLEKQQATQIASRVTGVRNIENEILIDSDNSQSDAEIEEQIDALLQEVEDVDLSQIDVAVDNGVVTLAGSVPTLYAQNTAIGSALVEGVEAVDAENLTVEPSGSVE
ncbi:MAG: BON domain-containing protein [Thainema sp.]